MSSQNYQKIHENPLIMKIFSKIYRHQTIFTIGVLVLIYILAFAVRLFCVLRYESVIHEFDPYFNYRTTRFLVDEGLEAFNGWFDKNTWYPLGRNIGGTIYPGLMLTSAVAYKILHFFNLTVNIRNICVMLAPWMASNTILATFFLTREIKNSKAGLIAAAMIAIVPGYISRSVAGSYDNECVAIFALVLTFFFWVKAVKTGSMLWACFTALAYYYMVAAWGGYIFIINLIPIHVIILLLLGKFSLNIYVAYSTFYILGTLLSMQITFVGFQPVKSAEHLAAMGTFAFLQIYGCWKWLQSIIPSDSQKSLLRWILGSIVISSALLILVLHALGIISPWTGRFYSLLDPTYARDHIPIISSVSEHQPTAWSSFFFDLHCLLIFIPTGIWFCIRESTESMIFILLYTLTSVYFAGVMVRLMLVLAPAACVMGGIVISHILQTYSNLIVETPQIKKKPTKKTQTSPPVPREFGGFMICVIAIVLALFVRHSIWVTSEAYSSPSIVLSSNIPTENGHVRVIFDDFREAYSWLSQNTPEDAKVMSWWDYGYQITAIANRTTIVDNNTWNNTHIATVGRAMAAREEVSYEIMRQLDVDYVLVVFGGLTGYQSDDINKFLWMVRIGGGIFPDIVENDYFSESQEFKVDSQASPTMLNSLMYKMCYYRYGEIPLEIQRGQYVKGYDRVRRCEIGKKDFEFTHLEEAFTSEHWIVRIYRVLPPNNRY